MTFRELLESGRKFTGCFMQYPSIEIIEILGYCGLDYIIIDLEHGSITDSAVQNMIRGAENVGMAAVIRISKIEESIIKKTLDMGASGIVVPNVKSADDARKIVKYAKYYPEGRRGACPYIRANRYGINDAFKYYEHSNGNTTIAILLEDMLGLNELEEITKVSGIDVISVGNVDLSVSMGLWGQPMHPDIMEQVKRVAEIAHSQGKYSDAFIFDPNKDFDIIADWKGISYYCLPSPEAFIINGYKKLLKEIKLYGC